MRTYSFFGFDTTNIDPEVFRKFINCHFFAIDNHAKVIRDTHCIDWSTELIELMYSGLSDEDFMETVKDLRLEVGVWCISYIIAFIMSEETEISFVYAHPDDAGREGVGFQYKDSDVEKSLCPDSLAAIVGDYAKELECGEPGEKTFYYSVL